jgi:hypothetical protein
MSTQNGKFKNRGPKSKKTARKVAADARKVTFDALTPAEQQERKAANKASYKK